MEGMSGCKCPHHKFISILVVLFALLFLLGELGTLSERFVSLSWPILVGLAGLLTLFGGGCKCCMMAPK